MIHVTSEQFITMLQRSLMLIDPRLAEHGSRVALLSDAMWSVDGSLNIQFRKELYLLAMLHDIGVKHMAEVNRLFSFDQEASGDHAIYGYLFLREMSPAKELSKVILYHHSNLSQFQHEPEIIQRAAQILHIADRADIMLFSAKQPESHFRSYLEKREGVDFEPEIISLFWQTYETRFQSCNSLHLPEGFLPHEGYTLSGDQLRQYLELLVIILIFAAIIQLPTP